MASDPWRNVYSNPEDSLLEIVAEIDYSDRCYCFDRRVVWKHLDTGLLYTGRHSGCSCPGIFEDYHSIDDLERFTLSEVEDEAKEEARKDYYEGDPVNEFLEKIRMLDNEPRRKLCPAGGD